MSMRFRHRCVPVYLFGAHVCLHFRIRLYVPVLTEYAVKLTLNIAAKLKTVELTIG